jgi:hypothetical protein
VIFLIGEFSRVRQILIVVDRANTNEYRLDRLADDQVVYMPGDPQRTIDAIWPTDARKFP